MLSTFPSNYIENYPVSINDCHHYPFQQKQMWNSPVDGCNFSKPNDDHQGHQIACNLKLLPDTPKC